MRAADLEEISYWTVEGPTYVFRVDAAAARAIELELLAGIVEFIRFTDLGGSVCIYRREEIRGLWDSTPVTRQRERAINASLKAEQPMGSDD